MQLRNAVRATITTALMTSAGACGSSVTNPGTQPLAPSGVVVPLERFGAPSATAGAPCGSGKYRDFDFWLGNWNIQTAAGAPAGVSVVSKLVAGCAMLEFYQGGAGQSLNSYDASTDTWNQFYIFAQPGILLLRGGLVNGEMVLTEQRGPATLDRWTWSRTHADTVWQRQQFTVNGTVQGGFQGRYVRRSDTPPSPALPSGGAPCPSIGLAFMVGSWNVYEGVSASPSAFRGSMKATLETKGCVIIERVAGANGFSGISFAARHPVLAKVLREYMDSDGRYLRLSGDGDATKFTLTGARKALDGTTVTVRVTWAPQSSNDVTQMWEFSRDGGATWGDQRQYLFVRE